MPIDLNNILVVGISSRALFDLEKENSIFENEPLGKYIEYQRDNENTVLSKGTAFPLIEALLKLNNLFDGEKVVEVIVMSRNSPDTGLRILNSIKHYGLDIIRSAFSGGEPLSPYLESFKVDLFLSKDEGDVQYAIDNGVAAALLYAPPKDYEPDTEHIRIAFDADAVIFSDESEQIYKEHGLEAFQKHESENEDNPIPPGNFMNFLEILSRIQNKCGIDNSPLKVAIVTARSFPANIRIIKTLRSLGVYVNESFFLGGLPKDEVLKAFRPHIFFDDQDVHAGPASQHVPSGRVPYKSNPKLKK
ncbi:5'-nucleotidase [Denitrovibrio acetiphilus DSM 12809]|uniref:5'-nucleotidase n=1 Tax=Denitrovibrio acetiphilus (strain DSM 12809 / NBRC 114555 / N2460) TaxID=522772 RepID=D4H4J6_DENA2|nr:5'-nucleotidase [Denitrovibrio acetiphilus]ADD69325.1 5'-nucleotidase [Denitrovibrio acetiphilus DSM 12809]